MQHARTQTRMVDQLMASKLTGLPHESLGGGVVADGL